MDNNDDIRVYMVPLAAVAPTSDVSQAEWDEMLAIMEDLQAGIAMEDLTNVTGGATNGQTLIRSGTSWVPGTPNTSIAIHRDTAGATYVGPANRLDFEGGLTADDVGGALRKKITIVFGGTGSATTPARSDHSHSAEPQTLVDIAASGTLSSGTRVLRNAAGPALANGVVYDVSACFTVYGRNNVNSGTVNVNCRVGGNGAYPQRSRSALQTVGGVPTNIEIKFIAELTGTGAAVTEYFAIQHNSGDAIDLRTGEVHVSYRPRR